MPQFSTKHKNREKTFSFNSFHGGYNEERSASFLNRNELSSCKNMRYVKSSSDEGEQRVVLKKRPGTVRITGGAVDGAIQRCFYYKNKSKYIVYSYPTLYYLAGGTPTSIGNLYSFPNFTEFNSKLIIHDSGRTKYWDGTTFDTINVYHTDELLATGDDAEDDFAGTLDHIPVEPDTVSITFTGTSVALTITDDGEGALVGDVNAGGTNTINYTTGAYDFKTSEAPDDATLVEIDYEQADSAPRSSAGLVRKSRIYTWGDYTNPSRLTYSAVNDEKSTETSSGGGYVDIDPDDGDQIMGAINFQTSMLVFKESSLHRIDDYPGDDTFKVEKLTDDLGCMAKNTIKFEGSVVSFLSNEGWVAMSPSDRYGDIQKGISMSEAFKTKAANSTYYSYSEYNPGDKQLWLAMGYATGEEGGGG